MSSSTSQKQMCLRSTLDKTVTNKSLLCLANGDQRKPSSNTSDSSSGLVAASEHIASSNNGTNQRRSQRRQRSVSTLGWLKTAEEVIVDDSLPAASNIGNNSSETLKGATASASAYQAQRFDEYQRLCQVAKSRSTDCESSATTTATNLEQCAEESIAADLAQPNQEACQRPSQPILGRSTSGWKYMLRRRMY